MKTIMAFGDSLTHGEDPQTGCRHSYQNRWPGALDAQLDGKASVIEEGLGGRTTVFDDMSGPSDRNGARILPMLLGSHAPLDLVIIMLGTNDLKRFLSGSAYAAMLGMKRLVEITRTFPYRAGYPVPDLILVAPPHVFPASSVGPAATITARPEESHLFATFYSDAARELDCGFFDAALVAHASPIDGVHLDAPNSRAIGVGLAPVVLTRLFPAPSEVTVARPLE